jgi:Pyruvate/2-oxoacid:ferredoxin oxidoreductase delta subunit
VSEEPYLKLRDFLDEFPIGFPETPEGTEIKILKKLFTDEEAKIAVHLSAIPEKVSRIARRAGYDKNLLEPILYEMSKKGLIFRVKRDNNVLYNAAPFMIGLYEYSVKKVDKELAKLFKEYYDEAFLDELASSDVPGFKVIPIEETIKSDTTLYPYQKLEESIKNARVISVTDCICRKEARLLGHGCDFPIETCLSFGAAAEYYIENGIGRKVSAEEAISIIRMADEAGLVHAGANSKHLSNICNCCPCCCASMKGITKLGLDKHRFLNAMFESIIDQETCISCGNCIERCPVKAISLEEFAIVDRELCLGCGLCASVCPEDAIAIQLRKDGEEPFNRILELGKAIYEGKRKSLKQ